MAKFGSHVGLKAKPGKQWKVVARSVSRCFTSDNLLDFDQN